jgi:hypothetical protein
MKNVKRVQKTFRGDIKISKHRKHATRSDRQAAEQLKKGFLLHDGKLRFITLTNVRNMKQFKELRRFYSRQIQEYFGVLTAEGGGVIHLVYVGLSIRRSELSKRWTLIAGAWNVHISKVEDYPKVLREMCFQHEKQRYFHSLHWSEAVKSKQQNLTGEKLDEYYNELTMKFIS